MKQLAERRYGWNYDDLISSMEVQILHKVEEESYSGSSFYLVQDGDRFGLLTFGWGSCSGCDALAACSTVAQATELRDQLWGQIHWEESAAALLAYMDAKDWSLSWEWHDDTARQFLTEAKTQLVRIVRDAS